MKERTPAAWLLLAALILLAAPSPTPVLADGDPLEEYDFSGKVPHTAYVQQDRTRVYRHGLWTVQRHVDLDPFGERVTWHLTGCTNERINIYYGTRPMWSSHRTLRVYLPGDVGKDAKAHWTKVEDTLASEYDRAPDRMPVRPAPGGDGILLCLRYWNGGASAGASRAWVRLSGTEPASAKVETLWAGAYHDVVDLDGDGEDEIVDSDFAHEMASYLTHKGVRARVVLAWDATRGRFAVANDRLYVPYFARRAPPKGEATPTEATWVAHCRGLVTRAMRTYAADPKAHWARGDAVLLLAQALTHLLWRGYAEEALALLDSVELPHFGPHDAEPMAKKDWWAAYLAGCRRSRYWKELTELFPKLGTLR
ncbi:MAG: hypothetical protein P1V36_16810 [Planctomycetota bacterium]|nr:hypothetical protein [Planctomycetota bacterium]